MAVATIGITRKLDELGRMVIPQEYRKQLKIEAQDELEIIRVGSEIRIRKVGKPCSKCGAA